jgi:hypothetical protein
VSSGRALIARASGVVTRQTATRRVPRSPAARNGTCAAARQRARPPSPDGTASTLARGTTIACDSAGDDRVRGVIDHAASCDRVDGTSHPRRNGRTA